MSRTLIEVRDLVKIYPDHQGGEVRAVDGAHFVTAALIVPAQAGSVDPGIIHDWRSCYHKSRAIFNDYRMLKICTPMQHPLC